MNRLITPIVIIVAIIAAGFVTPSFAQADKPKCDPAAVIAKANALKSSKDDKTDMAALISFSQEITAANIACNGFTFSGKGKKVLGPVSISEGLYKVTVTTQKGFAVVPKPVSKECGTSYDVPDLSLYRLSDETEPVSEASLTVPHTCRLAFDVNRADTPWTLTIEPLE
jgi:hypothetical protein